MTAKENLVRNRESQKPTLTAEVLAWAAESTKLIKQHIENSKYIERVIQIAILRIQQ